MVSLTRPILPQTGCPRGGSARARGAGLERVGDLVEEARDRPRHLLAERREQGLRGHGLQGADDVEDLPVALVGEAVADVSRPTPCAGTGR